MLRTGVFLILLIIPLYAKVATPAALSTVGLQTPTQPAAPKDASPLCSGCMFVANLLEGKLKVIEKVTEKDLTAIADKICAKAPKVEVVETLCTNVRDDLIDIAVQVIEAIERQASGNVTCKALKLCLA